MKPFISIFVVTAHSRDTSINNQKIQQKCFKNDGPKDIKMCSLKCAKQKMRDNRSQLEFYFEHQQLEI